MPSAKDQSLARELMEDFAERTGLVGERPPRRYLWTDAFALCNVLGLHRRSGDDRHLDLALRLVDQVHHTLGRHREDDRRHGWISGLPEAEGERHPTAGGLRIGKPQPERGPREAPDPRREWDRDGQYFHYLTKWMHALHLVAAETGEARYHRWAVELAVTAHRAFTVRSSSEGPPRMVWKMSIELDRPLVPSMGAHDPLDALVTYLELRDPPAGAEGEREGAGEQDEGTDQPDLPDPSDLETALEEAEAMCAGRSWSTDDPLGIGGLLGDAGRLARMIDRRGLHRRDLLRHLLEESAVSLDAFARTRSFDLPAEYRLGFRELGLAIGLHAVEDLRGVVDDPRSVSALDAIAEHLPLAERIEGFWRRPENRRAPPWRDHLDINEVMLATSLEPGGYLRV